MNRRIIKAMKIMFKTFYKQWNGKCICEYCTQNWAYYDTFVCAWGINKSLNKCDKSEITFLNLEVPNE